MRWILIDEREDQRNQFSRLLGNHGIEVVVEGPKGNLDFISKYGSVSSGFILDYALHEYDSTIPYSGTTLAAHIRQQLPGRPIVILSGRLGQADIGAQLRRTEELVDLTYKKDVVERRPDVFAGQLRNLSEGYAAIGGAIKPEGKGGRPAVRSILGLISDLESPGLARLDLEDLVSYVAQVGKNDAGLIARVLLREILLFPGPLLNLRHASVELGIDPEYAVDSKVIDYLAPAKYCGAFKDFLGGESEMPGRYWRSGLHELDEPPFSLPPVFCYICEGPATTLCPECGRPVDGLHSVPAEREDAAYPECRHARVCGNCIRKNELASELVVDEKNATIKAEVIKETRRLLDQRRRAQRRTV